MKQQVLHQFTAGMAVGDAISDQVFAIRGWLREQGVRSEIYAEHIDSRLIHEVRPLTAYRHTSEERVVIYHHSIGSALVEHLLGLPLKLLLIYHNVTPPEFVAHMDPAFARQLQRGLDQLPTLREHTLLGLGDSPFNESELRAAGYHNTGVLPITFDPTAYAVAQPPSAVDPAASLVLFVGRIAPHKRQEDLIKLLYYYQQLEPNAQVALVGSTAVPAYAAWLKDLTRTLGLTDRVIFTGHVSQAEMVGYLRRAQLYVSMSEHEGFGKPLIECMYCGLPVLAYAVTSVPGTLGGAGVLFHRKEFAALAELVDILVQDQILRQQIITRQQAQVQGYLAPQVKAIWQRYWQELEG